MERLPVSSGLCSRIACSPAGWTSPAWFCSTGLARRRANKGKKVMTDIETRDMPLNWDMFVTIRQGIASDLPPGKEQLMWTPDSATLIYGQRDAVLVDAF